MLCGRSNAKVTVLPPKMLLKAVYCLFSLPCDFRCDGAQALSVVLAVLLTAVIKISAHRTQKRLRAKLELAQKMERESKARRSFVDRSPIASARIAALFR